MNNNHKYINRKGGRCLPAGVFMGNNRKDIHTNGVR